MRNLASLLAEHSFALKGVFLWTDLVSQAYGVLPAGWTFIWHDQHLMICQDGILRISRPAYLPLVQELPAILRYLKRFGYQEETPLTLLQTSPLTDTFPPFVHQESRIPTELSLYGFTFQIPELVPLHRLYAWPRHLQKTAYIVTLFTLIGIAYLGWHIKTLSDTRDKLAAQLDRLPPATPISNARMEAFRAYCHLWKDQPQLLPLLRQLSPVIKEEAVATHLHWTTDPLTLTLHLELMPSVNANQLVFKLRSNLQQYQITWQEKEDDPLKGILTLTPHEQERS
jgi:hypothetical protein